MDLTSPRSQPAIAPEPVHRRAATDLLRLAPYLLPYRWRWVAMVVIAVVSLAATVAIPLMTKAVIDGPVRHRDPHGLWVVGSAAVAIGVAEALSWFIRRWLVSRATVGVETDIRKDLYARLQILPVSFHGRWQSGQLLSRIMNDLSTIRRLLAFGLVFLMLNVLQIIVVTGILLAMYWPLGVVVLASIVPVTVTMLRFERTFTVLSRTAQDQAGHVATYVEEAALGVRAVKSFGREDYVYDRFDQQATALYDTGIRKISVSARFWTLLEAIPNLALIIVLGLGAYAAGRGLVSMGTLVAFITMMLSLVWPIASLGFLWAMTQEAMTAADRIAEIFDAPVEITDGPRRDPARGGRVEFDDVGFAFPASDDDAGRATSPAEESADAASRGWVLRHLSFVIEPGQTLALVGATGSGKSVMAMLLPRLYDVTEGAIRLDGNDIRELSLPALRRSVAVAFEDPTLFSMSVSENLALGRSSADLPDEQEVDRAVGIAAADFVYDLPFGLQTRIGEQGMSLSGGQRQRLALARAILARPRVLVLDDTLSALDVHTEAAVTDALRHALSEVTAIVVAHRASTVLLADRVALLDAVAADDGGYHTITHIGTHEELLAGVPRYRYLLAAGDDIDDGSEPHPDWEDEAARRRLADIYDEAQGEAGLGPAGYPAPDGGGW